MDGNRTHQATQGAASTALKTAGPTRNPDTPHAANHNPGVPRNVKRSHIDGGFLIPYASDTADFFCRQMMDGVQATPV